MATPIILTSPNALAPIQRLTSAQRLANFTAQSDSLYNKFSPHSGMTGQIGFDQPFVYTKLTDSNVSKNLTKYDNQAFPIGSTVRDLQRVGKFMASGTGLLFLGKQYLLQNQSAFNETRIYNPLSVLGATAQSGTAGLMNRPKRYVDSGGSLIGTFLNALKSSVGMSTGEAVISGTATGDQNGTGGGTPYSTYAGARGGAKAGFVRFETAAAAISRFDSLWVTGTTSKKKGGLFESLKTTFLNAIPSTNPRGDGYSSGLQWKFRPEYSSKDEGGIFEKFMADGRGMFTEYRKSPNTFYNIKSPSANEAGKEQKQLVADFHKYTPDSSPATPGLVYASPSDIAHDEVGVAGSNIKLIYDKMLAAIGTTADTAPQLKASAEMYTDVKDYNPSPRGYTSYKEIPSQTNSNAKFYTAMMKADGATPVVDRPNPFSGGSGTANSKYFAGASGSNTYDAYNAIEPSKEFGMSNKRGDIPWHITGWNEGESRDIIFFYFFDLINEMYIPFRATITGLSEQNSADWEDVTYMGRADKLFVYKGFSRDINFGFSVYANSIKELIPMWKRINYLVGLTRPSKYTNQAVVTNQSSTYVNDPVSGTTIAAPNSRTGLESQFIYPPMVTLRLGDLYNDQPCVISSISVNIPDDTNWESYRGDDYNYLFGPNSVIKVKGAKSRQLPLKADISLTLKVMEKSQSITSATDRFGFEMPL